MAVVRRLEVLGAQGENRGGRWGGGNHDQNIRHLFINIIHDEHSSLVGVAVVQWLARSGVRFPLCVACLQVPKLPPTL